MLKINKWILSLSLVIGISTFILPGCSTSNKTPQATVVPTDEVSEDEVEVEDEDTVDPTDSENDNSAINEEDTEAAVSPGAGKISETSSTQKTATAKVFTKEELAKFDGKNGKASYVAIDGKVYDVTNSKAWKEGMHQGNMAGADLSEVLKKAPHGDKILSSLPMVGELAK